jgi:hypothetical protein
LPAPGFVYGAGLFSHSRAAHRGTAVKLLVSEGT